MKKILTLGAVLSIIVPSVALAERFSFDELEEAVNMAHYMGWTCYESATENMITVECGSFIRFCENELGPLGAKMTEEMQRSGSLMFRQVEEHRLDELTYKQQEIGELYVFADRLRNEALENNK